ncbi:hypothetical protein [Jiangella gansuensis]|uniref:hypothetical protein n=1 Tax=Jiangella gansuensis TaxID=281473 RepID=UPI00146FA52C|nr:hypothetical protein [Jiangella gansuensis]
MLIVEPGAFRTSFAGPALRSTAAMPDYEATVGNSRAALAAMDGVQPGDPDKAAAATLAALRLPAPPLRLALGDDAVAGIRAQLAAVADDLDRTHRLGTGAATAHSVPNICVQRRPPSPSATPTPMAWESQFRMLAR